MLSSSVLLTVQQQQHTQHSRTAAVNLRWLQQTTRSARGGIQERFHSTSSAEIWSLHPSSGTRTSDGQFDRPLQSQMSPDTADAGTLARLPWHSTSTTGNFWYHWSTSSIYTITLLFRTNWSHWQDVLCDGLELMPTTTITADVEQTT